MDTQIETREVAGLTVELHADYDAQNPLRDWDHAWTLIGGYGCEIELDDYVSSADFSDPDWIRGQRSPGDVVALLQVRDYGSQGGNIRRVSDLEEANAIAVINRKVIAEEWAETADAYTYLDGIVSEVNSYLRGEVYGFVVDAPEGLYEACWGFVGDTADCWAEGESAARSIRAELDDRHLRAALLQVGGRAAVA